MSSRLPRPGRRLLFALLFGALILTPRARVSADTGAQVILNGDLGHGSGTQPDHWRTEAWINEPSACRFNWARPTWVGAGELEVQNLKPNDARWVQSLSLTSGWYYLSAEIRTENVGREKTGADISLLEDGIVSPDLRGTSNWTRVGFYLKVGRRGADVEVALRLGGFASLNTGRAYFRHVSARRLAELPPAPRAGPVYDLGQIRKESASAPIGSPFSLAATLAILLLIALWGWRTFLSPPRRPSRAEARRQAKEAARR
jgi:hypothetical protein